jgi:histidine triad (HIT) family protein
MWARIVGHWRRVRRDDQRIAPTDWYCDDVLSGKLVVDRLFEDDRVIAFHHPYPSGRPHVVVIPKAHVSSLLAPEAIDAELLMSMLTAVQRAAGEVDFADAGFCLRANAGAPGVTPHMHWHLLPGAGADWPEFPGCPEKDKVSKRHLKRRRA